jgi:DDE domain
MFATEIRKRHVAHMRGCPQWRGHLDEVFVKVNGKLCYLWRAIDHEGEVLEAVATARRDKAAALRILKRIMKKYGLLAASSPMGFGPIWRDERDRIAAPAARGRRSAQHSRREFASAVSATRTGDAALSKFEDAAEVQLGSYPGA